MKLIGLTGGIATGKSTVSKMLLDHGLPVIDADILAREVVQPGSFGLEALVGLFGKGLLNKDGSLNRAVLRDKVFSNPDARKIVENITHPLIHWRAQREFEAHRIKGTPVVFYDAALLFEKNLAPLFDEILVVRADPEVQLDRLMNRDKISKEEALKLLETQWPIEKKAALAHRLIDNSGSLEKTKKQVSDLIAAIS